jgi:hypothetical protein
MNKNVLICMALVAMTAVMVEIAHAGSAVAIQRNHSNLATAYGGPVEREKERALDLARRKYGPDVKLLAWSDTTGYGAIAVARHPNGYGTIIGVSLGKRSATEADTLAIEKCLKAGGKNPQVKWAFRG